MKIKHLSISGLTFLLAATCSAALANDAKTSIHIKVKTDGEAETVIAENLAEGEVREWISESGKEIVVRKENGQVEVTIDGEVIDIMAPPPAMQPKAKLVKHHEQDAGQCGGGESTQCEIEKEIVMHADEDEDTFKIRRKLLTSDEDEELAFGDEVEVHKEVTETVNENGEIERTVIVRKKIRKSDENKADATSTKQKTTVDVKVTKEQ